MRVPLTFDEADNQHLNLIIIINLTHYPKPITLPMKKNIIRQLAGLCLLFCYSVLTQAQTFSAFSDFDTLENIRDNIVIPELTPAENRVLAEQAQILLTELYVNRQAKQDFYNGEVPDPVPLINELVASLDGMTTEEVARGIYDIFISQRDLHLNYVFPAPHASFTSFLPLTFTRTADKVDDVDIRVSAINAQMFAEFAPDQRVPAIGDLVVGYDGLSIKDAIERQMTTAQGANRYGGISRAIGQMTFIPHLAHLPPANDEITITFQESSDRPAFFGEQEGPEYTITLPWLSAFSRLLDLAPLDGSVETPQAQVNEDINLQARADKIARTRKIEPQKIAKEALLRSSDLWQERYADFQKEMKLKGAQLPSLPTLAENLSWGIIENQFGKFAYLKLDSFINADLVLTETRRLIDEEFRDTLGLILDIRDNPGGSIILADNLSQLFTSSRANVARARALTTPINELIFNDNADLLGEQWVRAFERGAQANRPFTGTTFFNPRSDANQIGQAYFAPVAVFNNARSFSASDLLTCAMRDNDAALIFGEDPLTGAGGANVITHSLFNLLAPSEFESLPGDHAMRASWRQIIRFGDARGEILEDNGCGLAGLRVDLSRNDLINNNADQIETMTRELARLARAPQFTPAGQTDGFQVDRVLFSNDPNPQIAFDVTDTDFVQARRFRQNEPRIDVFARRRETREVGIDLRPGRFKRPVTYRFFGLDLIGRPLWNTRRSYTLIGDKFMVGDEVLDLTFGPNSENDRTLAILNRGEAEDDEGWFLSEQGLEFQSAGSLGRLESVETESSAYIGLDLSNVTNADLEVDFEIIAPGFFNNVALLINFVDGNGIELRSTDILDFQFIDSPLITQTYDISAIAGRDTALIELQASGILPTLDAEVIRVRGIRVIPK